MIKRTDKGYQVVSHSGKPLSQPDLPKKQAEDRLQEVEFFKRVKQATDEGKKKVEGTKPKRQGEMSLAEMQERKKFQDKGYKQPTEKMPDKMSEGEKKAIELMSNKEKKEQKPAKEEKPFDTFNRLQSSLPDRHKQSLNKVLYGK